MTGYRFASLTTDYGTLDGFTAACHGVMLGIAPDLRIIDVTHGIPPGDVRRGAHVLAQTVPHLPRAVHVAVVDPGVGTMRRPVAVGTPNGILVGPDNGLLVWAAEALGGITAAVALTAEDWHRHPVSHTFHGRDIFAPIAAHLASGVPLDDVGEAFRPAGLLRLPAPMVTVTEDGVDAEVITVDRFGNVQLGAQAGVLDALDERLEVNGRPAVRANMFAAVPDGDLVVLADSAGYVAVAVNGGSAAERLGVSAGDLVRLR